LKKNAVETLSMIMSSLFESTKFYVSLNKYAGLIFELTSSIFSWYDHINLDHQNKNIYMLITYIKYA